MKLISFSELQEILGGRSRSSIYRDIDSGRLPKPIRFGSRCYWKTTDIEAAIEKAVASTVSLAPDANF